jgi:hypothetical protein
VRLTGPRLLSLIALAVGAMWIALAVTTSPAEAAARATIRWTGRTSLVLFALVYVARPLVQLWPSPAAKALLARRKWLGLGFATSHGLHLIGIVWLASLDLDAFLRARGVDSLVSTVTFVAIGVMTVTSIEPVKRAMAARTWRRLHGTGLQLAWLVFMASYAPVVTADPLYAVATALLAGIAAVRIAAWLRQRRRRRAAA